MAKNSDFLLEFRKYYHFFVSIRKQFASINAIAVVLNLFIVSYVLVRGVSTFLNNFTLANRRRNLWI